MENLYKLLLYGLLSELMALKSFNAVKSNHDIDITPAVELGGLVEIVDRYDTKMGLLAAEEEVIKNKLLIK